MTLIAGFQIMRQAIGAASLSRAIHSKSAPYARSLWKHERVRNMAEHKNPCVAAGVRTRHKSKTCHKIHPSTTK
ncbi:MAG: hypothetical protein QOE55_1428 [Acidobacteriaceae bacterium]|nr:hypothetical protein [Acidobacteriaceae bacterium]